MLKIAQSKILLAILAAVLALGGYLIHVRQSSERAAAAAEQGAGVLRQQQTASDAAKQHDADTWNFVRKQRQKNNSSPSHGSKTWTTYVP